MALNQENDNQPNNRGKGHNPNNDQVDTPKTGNFNNLLAMANGLSESYRDTAYDEGIRMFLERLNAQAEEASAQNRNQLGIKFHLVADPAVCGIMSIIAISNKHEYFALLLEDGVHNPSELNDMTENYQGQQITIDNDTSRYINQNYLTHVTKHMRSITGNNNLTFLDYAIVKKGMLADEKYIPETAGVFYGTVASALKNANAGRGISLADIRDNDSYLLNDVQFDPGQTVGGVLDENVAIDFRANLTVQDNARRNNNQPVALNSGRQSIDIATVGGVIDFVYVPPSDMAQRAMHQPMYAPQYVPAFEPVIKLTYITGTSNKFATAVEDINTVLYAILAAAPMAAPMQYLAAFTRPGKASLGLLGAVWEPDPAAPQPVLEEIKIADGMYNSKRGDNELTVGEIAQRYIRENVNVTLIAEKGSRMNWAMRPFVEAANSPEAAAYLFNAVNEFTNREFGKLWNKDASIIAKQMVTLHTGHYKNANGEICDIQSFGLLDLIKAYGKNAYLPQNIPAFSESLMPGMSQGDSAKLYIHRRREMIESATGFTKTGLADQLFFHPEFLVTFIEACEKSGVTMANQGLIEVQSGTHDYSSWVSGRVLQSSSLFGQQAHGYTQPNGSRYLHGDNFHRY